MLSIIVGGILGHSSSGSHTKPGPPIYSFVLRKVSAEIPLDAISTGLSFVGTYLQSEGSEVSCIRASRFATKV